MRSNRWRAFGAVVLAALVAAGCGGDRGDETSTSETTVTTEADGGQQGGDESFGDLESPCGEGEGGPATEQGVTETEIKLGYGDDAGFPNSPGLSHETSDAVEALIAWCNDQGGINGRQITGTYYDAKITEVGNAITAACGEQFMLVGQAWALDAGQEETRLACGMPTVPAFTASAVTNNAPMLFQGVPSPIDLMSATWAQQLAELFPQEVKKAATVYGNFVATLDNRDKHQQAAESQGWEYLGCDQEYNLLGEADWRPFAQKLKDCGAEVVMFIGQAYPNFQNLLDAAAQLDFRPVWITQVNNYLESFAQWNTNGNGDRVHAITIYTPFEQSEDNPATQKYVEIVEDDGGDISTLGAQAASSFLLWATAADACGADLTRQCVVEELEKIDAWDAGGLHQETNPAGNEPSPCSMLLRLDGGEWVQAHPEEAGEFECDEEATIELTGRVVEQAELGPDRVSTLHQ